LRREGKSVQTGFGSKPLEFEGFKIRIVKGFPDAQVFNGVAVSHPVGNDGSRVIAFKLGYIGQRDVIILVDFENGYVCLLYVYFCHLDKFRFNYLLFLGLPSLSRRMKDKNDLG
jgi:hypothetical protein